MVKNMFRNHGNFVDNDKIVPGNIPVYRWRLITFHWDVKCRMNSIASDYTDAKNIHLYTDAKNPVGAATRIFVFVATSSLMVESIVYVFPDPGLPVTRIGFLQELLVSRINIKFVTQFIFFYRHIRIRVREIMMSVSS